MSAIGGTQCGKASFKASDEALGVGFGNFPECGVEHGLDIHA